MRTIKFEYINPEHARNIGIYVIYVGDKMYLGRAKNIRQRMSMHKKVMININARTYLSHNPHIDTVYIEVVEICDTVTESVLSEKDWMHAFNHAGFHDILLNIDRFGKINETYIDMYEPPFIDLMRTEPLDQW